MHKRRIILAVVGSPWGGDSREGSVNPGGSKVALYACKAIEWNIATGVSCAHCGTGLPLPHGATQELVRLGAKAEAECCPLVVHCFGVCPLVGILLGKVDHGCDKKVAQGCCPAQPAL
jgi:hypothetical protein